MLLRYIEKFGFPGELPPGSFELNSEVEPSKAVGLERVACAPSGESTAPVDSAAAALPLPSSGSSAQQAPLLRILDFSGGTGMLGIAAAQLAPYSHVVISEFSSTALDQIRHNCVQSGVDPARCVAAKYAWGKTDADEFIAAYTRTGGAARDTDGDGDEEVGCSSIDVRQVPVTDDGGGGFEVVLCSDCLFITVRDGRECDFVSSLVSLCHDKTVVLTAHKMRLWEQEELVVQLLREFFEVREITVAVGDGLMDDFFGSDGDEGGGMFSMFEEAPEIYFCEMRLRGPDTDADVDGEQEQEQACSTSARASARSRRQLALDRLQSIDSLWSGICGAASE